MGHEVSGILKIGAPNLRDTETCGTIKLSETKTWALTLQLRILKLGALHIGDLRDTES